LRLNAPVSKLSALRRQAHVQQIILICRKIYSKPSRKSEQDILGYLTFCKKSVR